MVAGPGIEPGTYSLESNVGLAPTLGKLPIHRCPLLAPIRLTRYSELNCIETV